MPYAIECTLRFPRPRQEAFDALRSAVTSLGWSVESTDACRMRIAARSVSWWAITTVITAEVTPAGDVWLEARSAWPTQIADSGRNAAKLKRLQNAIAERLGAGVLQSRHIRGPLTLTSFLEALAYMFTAGARPLSWISPVAAATAAGPAGVPATLSPPPTARPADAGPHAVRDDSDVRLLDDVDAQESTRIVGQERLPLDNRFGSKELSVENEFVKTMTNEITVDQNRELAAKVGFDVFKILQSEINGKISRQIGTSTGETVTRKYKSIFTVDPGKRVVYQVTWKQRVRSGALRATVNGAAVQVPYEARYSLEYEVTAHAE